MVSVENPRKTAAALRFAVPWLRVVCVDGLRP
jgi:hypothetical protein